MELGVQLFGCSSVFREDTERFFDKLNDMGYTQIEPCILFDSPEESEIAKHFTGILWSPDEVAGFKKSIDKRGMHLRSAHAFCSDIEKHSDTMFKLAKEQGISSFVFNIPASAHNIESLRAYIAGLDRLSEKLKPTGCEVWIHNVQRDFAPWEGSSVFETALKLSKNIYSQIDTGWAIFDGKNAEELIALPETKLHGLHIKELSKGFENKKDKEIFAVLGDGVTVLPPLLKAAKSVYVVIDQDMAIVEFMDDLEKSIKAVREAEAI